MNNLFQMDAYCRFQREAYHTTEFPKMYMYSYYMHVIFLYACQIRKVVGLLTFDYYRNEIS